MRNCPFFSVYMHEQLRRLALAIDEHKWYMSERAGFDVGYDAAEKDFRRRYLDRFAREFRLDYCLGVCPGRHCCDLAQRVGRTPTSMPTPVGVPAFA